MSAITVLPVTYQGSHCYDIELYDSFTSLPVVLERLGMSKKRLCIVSDSTVASYYADEVEQILQSQGCPFVYRFIFPAGEEHKTLDVIENLYEFLIQKAFDRSDVLLALGGGVTGDMTGYAAATYLRGIRFIQIPTTLLSMVDSSIGGKTGVDFRGYKNMVGAFYQPSFVYVNLTTLHSLDSRQFASGMGEVIKHGLITSSDYFSKLKEQQTQIMALELSAVTDMVCGSQKIKRQIVEEDPKEKGIRAFLNFGHTIGHAIEKSLEFSLLHGECVALGMVAAAYISYNRGELAKEEQDTIESLLASYGLPIRFQNLCIEEILHNCTHDKKKEGDHIRFVLLHSIGTCYTTKDVTTEEMERAIIYLKEGTAT